MNIKEYLDFVEKIKDKNDSEIKKLIIEDYLKINKEDNYLKTEIKVNEFLNILNNETFVQRFVYNKVEYGFIPNLDEMSTGEYIDLDHYLKENDTLRAIGILYRPIKKTYKDLYSIEKYNKKFIDNFDEHIKNVENFDSVVVSGALSFFFSFRQEFIGQYPNLFKVADEVIEEEDNKNNLSSLKQEEQSFNEYYAWYSMLYQAAGEDYLKMDKVTKKTISDFLFFMEFLIQKNKIDIKKIKNNI